MRRSPELRLQGRTLETPDGDFVETLRLPSAPNAPRLLVLHGLEGTARSHYIGGMFKEMERRGWGMDLLLFRSCGDLPNRTARFYHSGETGDVAFVMDALMSEFPDSSFAAAGFSRGGKVLLKWLGELGNGTPTRLKAAVAISAPFDLSQSVDRIASGFSRIYERRFLASLQRKAKEKASRFPDHHAFRQLDSIRTLRGFDDVVTGPLHGFANADDYYARSSAVGWLHSITVPTLLLSARDDPFLPEWVLERVSAIAGANPVLTTEFHARGGHVGFVEGRWPWRPRYYAERRVGAFCAKYLVAQAVD